MLTLKIFVRATPHSFIIWPPIRARTMRTNRANTVPPGAAMEPRLAIHLYNQINDII